MVGKIGISRLHWGGVGHFSGAVYPETSGGGAFFCTKFNAVAPLKTMHCCGWRLLASWGVGRGHQRAPVVAVVDDQGFAVVGAEVGQMQITAQGNFARTDRVR